MSQDSVNQDSADQDTAEQTICSRPPLDSERGHILVVDDYPMNRLKLVRLLQQQGHSVAQAGDGEQALTMLRAEPFDVVLLDLLMPGVDGMQVLHEMKRDSALRDIPIIIISAVDEIEKAAVCIETGAEDYLQKPFNPVFLHARLSASLQRKKLRDLEKMYLQQEVMMRQNEKLATLGKLSAGVAHELNNPAAAAQRGAAHLMTSFARFQEIHLRLSELRLTQEQAAVLLELDHRALESAKKPTYIDALTRSDREVEWEEWLADQAIPDPWLAAPTLALLGYSRDELAALLAGFTPPQLTTVMEWLECSYTIYGLTEEIGHGTARISEIVRALKAYSYLDQAPRQMVNLHEGLDNTLIILRSKLQPGVMVQRDYAVDLPLIDAYGNELNQVWTNLIDNSIDAMGGKGEIHLRTRREGEWVVVEVEDNGPGIPAAIQANIFDPFYTTKPPGQGTGMGLNISHNIIVQRHKGRIDLHSKPGQTRFEVRLPFHPPTTP
ncbi:MAG: response regulator [Caldilineaceae bacterium]|nr:response regulator [Caldilineaceae bacterium]